MGVPTGRVTQAPTHGAVQIVGRDVFPTFPPGNPRFACNKMRVPGVAAEYTPAAGFVGSDFVAIEYIFADGRDVEQKFAISVK